MSPKAEGWHWYRKGRTNARQSVRYSCAQFCLMHRHLPKWSRRAQPASVGCSGTSATPVLLDQENVSLLELLHFFQSKTVLFPKEVQKIGPSTGSARTGLREHALSKACHCTWQKAKPRSCSRSMRGLPRAEETANLVASAEVKANLMARRKPKVRLPTHYLSRPAREPIRMASLARLLSQHRRQLARLPPQRGLQCSHCLSCMVPRCLALVSARIPRTFRPQLASHRAAPQCSVRTAQLLVAVSRRLHEEDKVSLALRSRLPPRDHQSDGGGSILEAAAWATLTRW
mmetsp:Transcript_77753/g.251880  ORF Transcript_77753/g.251880 Transcript_77753/m.251880 type:complete len:287 (+) Transcript_77753:657-1517(+)